MTQRLDPHHPYFFSAIQSNNADYFHKFIAEGNDINSKTVTDENALHFAVRSGHGSLVELLIQLGVNVNLQNNKGNTPLHLISSTFHNSFPVSSLHLIKAGANLNIENKKDETPLHLAIQHNNYIAAKLFIDSGTNLHRLNSFEQSFMHLAAIQPDFNILKLLIDAGASLDNPNPYGNRPIHFACQRTLPNHTQLLLNAGVNPNVQNNDGQTPLHLSLLNRTPSIEVLLNQPIDFSLLNKYGENVFHTAASEGCLEVFMKGIHSTNFHQNITVLNYDNESVLVLAQQSSHYHIVDFLNTYFEYYALKNSIHNEQIASKKNKI